jgi:hypothetical protein
MRVVRSGVGFEVYLEGELMGVYDAVLLDYEPLVGEARLDAYLFTPDTVPRESLEKLLGGGISLPDKPQCRVLYVHSLPPLRSSLRGAVGRLLRSRWRRGDRCRARGR